MSGPSRPVVVIGGTGFLGSHVVERLAASGIPVCIVSRGGSWPWGVVPPGVACVAADLSEPSSDPVLRELAASAAAVVNLAGALYRPGLPRETYAAVHVDGARRVTDALARAGDAGRPRRLVHVSTTGVLGPTGPAARSEDAAPRPSTPYEATKLEGERIALSSRRTGLEVVVVRPGLAYGPRDLHLLALFRSLANGTFRPVAGGRARWQPVWAGDVARAVVTAVDRRGADGGVFHVAGAETVTVLDLARRIAARLGTTVRGPGLPRAVAWAAGAALELAARPLGLDPPLSRSRVRTLTEDRLYRIDRVREGLGWVPETALDAGLDETVAWYRRHGHL